MFDFRLSSDSNADTYRFSLYKGAVSLSYRDAIKLWQTDNAFRSQFVATLAEVPFSAIRWECPAVTTATVEQPFEFVILHSPWLDCAPDSTPFDSYFTPTDANDSIVVFDNLGRDAELVVPSPRGAASAYTHLAVFTRQASSSENHALWRKVGEVMEARISNKPIWLNTAGGGVDWLHVRLDSRPKYYGYGPYRTSI